MHQWQGGSSMPLQQVVSFLVPMQPSKRAHLELQLPCSCHTGMSLPLSVLDLPVAFLVQVAGQLDIAGRLSLFRASKLFMEVVLDSTDSTVLSLQPMELQQQQMLRALDLMQQHAKAVTMSMCSRQQLGCQPEDKEWAQHARQLAHRSCSLLHRARHMGYLGHVTSLELTGTELAMPLMPVFSESCPNLTALTLQDSNITWDRVTEDSFSAVFPKLQSLCLHNVTGQAPSEACQQGLQQQLAQLTGLKSLHLLQDRTCPSNACRQLYSGIAAALTPTIVSQLVQLEVPCRPPASQWTFNHCSNLQVLHLQDSTADDELMQQLLRLPSLTSVSVSEVNIKQSNRGQVCCWQQLRVKRITLQSFAGLPLHCNLQIKGVVNGPVTIEIARGSTEVTRTHIQEALCNITTSNWVGWTGGHVSLRFESGSGPAQLLSEALQLCHGVGRLSISSAPLNDGMLAALAGFAALQQQGLVVDLTRQPAWRVAGLAGLIAHLPAGSSLVVSRIDDSTEAHVVELCSAARLSFALHVKRIPRLHGGAKELVRAGLLQRGCTDIVVHETQNHCCKCYGSSWDWVVIMNSGYADGLLALHDRSCRWAASLWASEE